MGKKEFTYTLQIDAEIQDLIAKTAKVKQSMQHIMSSGKAPGAEKAFDGIERAIDRLQQKTAQPIDSLSAFKGIQKDAAAIGLSLSRLGEQIDNLGNLSDADKIDLLPADAKKRIQEVQTALAAFETATAAAAQKSQDLVDAERDLASAEKDLRKAQGKVSEKQQLIDIQSRAVEESKDEAKAIKDKIDALKKYQSTLAAYENAGGNKSAKGDSKANEGKGLEGLNLPADRKAAQGAMPVGMDLKSAGDVEAAIAQLTAQYAQASKAVTDAEATQRRYTKQLHEASNGATVAQAKVNNLKGTVDGLNAEFEQTKVTSVTEAYSKLRTEAGKLGINLTDIPIDYTEENLNQLREALERVKTEGLDTVTASCNIIQQEFNETADSSDKMKESLERNKETAKELDDRMNQTQAFANRVKQFVGIEGAARLARKAFQDAYQTIKELDAAMTEMAVVTELDVGDYWDKLPEYTERANALGVSIKSAYESATLYYQQGLKTNEVVAMSNETLKMMKIAGLSAEDATNKMTAALRGFNMELNEASAQKVSDVYSKLAAITASDVNEISTAMTKTASIASSAGMEFETTAAFLSQIIETTRESAETAGTAMKTVIARFQELKKDPAEIGEVDGEIVDANKIETALRSVGVSLRDAKGQFRELDDVFLELSSKWGSLDTNTQRYIATIAAGSRQQSRFIAMMSDYSRTQDLVNAANNSAGASNQQFEKTLESLDSKLTTLKNSWNTFAMSLMDSTVLKAGIDLLNGIMTAINGVIAALDKIGLGGAASFGMVIAALMLGTKTLNTFEINMRKTDASGKKMYTTLGAIKKTGKDIVTAPIRGLKSLNQALKGSIQQQERLAALQTRTVGSSANLKLAKERLAKAERTYQTALRVRGKDSDSAAAAARRLRQAEMDLAFQEGTNAQILKEKAALQMMGIGTTEAEILALEGCTAAEFSNLVSKEMSNGASREEAIQRTLTALGIQGESEALTLNNLIRQNGLLSFLMELGLLILGRKSWKDLTKQENKNTGSKLLNIIATLQQAAANGTLLTTMWPILLATLVITAAVLALIAVITIIIAVFKAVKKASPAGELEDAKAASEKAAEAAQQAADAYNELSDSFNSLEDKYKTLDELTEGTREWKDAVREINSEVLALIEKYPELAKLVQNEGGVLTIDINSDEAQAVLDKYGEASYAATAASLAAQMDVNRKQEVVNFQGLSNDAKIGNETLDTLSYLVNIAGMLTLNPYVMGVSTLNMLGTASSRHEENVLTHSMSKALAEGLVVKNEDGEWQTTKGSEERLAELGLTTTEAERFAEELGNGTEELKEYGLAVEERKKQEEALLQGMASNAEAMVDMANFTEEEQKQINVAASAGFAESVYERELRNFSNMSSGYPDEAPAAKPRDLSKIKFV